MTDAYLVWGTGTGDTNLAAFDAALAEAGIHNYNLISLSSMLPPETTVHEVGQAPHSHEAGTLLPTVLATGQAADNCAAAGIGWRQSDDGGVLVEHSALSVDECRAKIRKSLAEARENRPDWGNWEEPKWYVSDVPSDEPACAVVAVTFPNRQLPTAAQR